MLVAVQVLGHVANVQQLQAAQGCVIAEQAAFLKADITSYILLAVVAEAVQECSV